MHKRTNRFGDHAATSEELRRILSSFKPTKSIVRPRRGIILPYPDGIMGAVFPSLQATGPDEYDLRDLELEDAGATSLADAELALVRFLSRQDGLAIMQVPMATFRALSRGGRVLLLKSLAEDIEESWNIPFLWERNGKVVEGWQAVQDNDLSKLPKALAFPR